MRRGVVPGSEGLSGVDAEHPALSRMDLMPGRSDQKSASNRDRGEVSLPRTGIVLGFETVDDGTGRVEPGEVALGFLCLLYTSDVADE